MTFDRGSGELVFSPAPGQQGRYDFSVTVSNGVQSSVQKLSLLVQAPSLPSTEVSGRVVDESGKPLAGIPVSIGTAVATTDASGNFLVVGVPEDPVPLSAGGAVAKAQDRQGLLAPVVQLLGHSLYSGANNAIAAPLILPKIDWTAPAAFTRASKAKAIDATNSAMPGFAIQMPAGAAGATSKSGTVELAQLPTSVSAHHFPDGTAGGHAALPYHGLDLTQSVN